MIKFFRKIRKQLLSENKISKYLLYAIGEIALVVIGILIAVQINNWKNERQDREREKTYLIEIKANLNSDKKEIKKALTFNNNKIATIDTIMTLLGQATSSDQYMEKFISLNSKLANIWPFLPVKTTYNNLLSSDKIDIIQNQELRNSLAEYYSFDFAGSTLEVVKQNTRNYSRAILPKLIGNKIFQKSKNFNIDFEDNDLIEIHNDRSTVSSLYIMSAVHESYSGHLTAFLGVIDELESKIDAELN